LTGWKKHKKKIIYCDAHYLPLTSRSFDTAFCFVVLPYVRNEAQVVREINRVLKGVLKRYLNWVQNSAFEGELTTGSIEELTLKLKDVVDEGEDSILFYSLSNPRLLKKIKLGIEKSALSTIS